MNYLQSLNKKIYLRYNNKEVTEYYVSLFNKLLYIM